MPPFKAVLGREIVSQDKFKKDLANLKSVVKMINDKVEGKMFLVGNNLTVADLIVAQSLTLAFQTLLDPGFRKQMKHVTQWYLRISRLPSFVKHCGRTKMTEVQMKPFDPNAKPEAPKP